jgi:hypothetical protein
VNYFTVLALVLYMSVSCLGLVQFQINSSDQMSERSA